MLDNYYYNLELKCEWRSIQCIYIESNIIRFNVLMQRSLNGLPSNATACAVETLRGDGCK